MAGRAQQRASVAARAVQFVRSERMSLVGVRHVPARVVLVRLVPTGALDTSHPAHRIKTKPAQPVESIVDRRDHTVRPELEGALLSAPRRSGSPSPPGDRANG